MYKQITGKEALKRIADGEEVYFNGEGAHPITWGKLSPSASWNIAEFISPTTKYTFAIKTEPMRRVYELDGLGEFAGKRVRITIEEIDG